MIQDPNVEPLIERRIAEAVKPLLARIEALEGKKKKPKASNGIPTPTQLLKRNKMTQVAECLKEAVIQILETSYAGNEISVTLEKIRKAAQLIYKAKKYKPAWDSKNEDWDKMEIEMGRAGWEMNYDKPGYNETWYAPHYKIDKKER